MSEGDYGWGDSDNANGPSFGGVGMAALVVASGLYCAAVWVASGLQPLPYLALRRRHMAVPVRTKVPNLLAKYELGVESTK
jgi:hypothetical protein